MKLDQVDVLHEVGGRQRILRVEQLVPDRTAGRQALFGHLHAQARDFLAGDHDFSVIVGRAELHAGEFQLLHDLAAVGCREVAVEQFHLRGGEARREEDDEGDQADADAGHGGQSGRAEVLHLLNEWIHLPRPLGVAD
jgi:hypothetical protein